MSRLSRICASLLLLSVVLSACGQVSTAPAGSFQCGLDVGVTMIEAFADHEPPRGIDYAGIVMDCAPVGLDLATQLSTSTDMQAVVHQRSDRTFSYTFDSSVLSNCTSSPVTGTYSYNLPLVLVVGQLDANHQLQVLATYVEPLPYIPADPSSYYLFPPKGGTFFALTDAQRIAKELYTDQDFPDNYFNQPDQPSDKFTLTLPANSQVQLHLPLIISYRTGDGEVNHNGQAGPGLEWVYDYQFQRNFDPIHLSTQTAPSSLSSPTPTSPPAQMVVTPCS